MLNITKVLLYLKEAGVFPSDEGGEVFCSQNGEHMAYYGNNYKNRVMNMSKLSN